MRRLAPVFLVILAIGCVRSQNFDGQNSVSESEVFKTIIEELKEIRQKMEQNQRKTEQKLTELKNEILKKLDAETETVPEITIRQKVLGEWKMIVYENWEGFKKLYPTWTLRQFSQNLKFELEDGKLKRSGGGYWDVIEGDEEGRKILYMEEDHLKTMISTNYTEDVYIENGKLYFVQNRNEESWKRIYEAEKTVTGEQNLEVAEKREENPVVAGNGTVIEEQTLEVEQKKDEKPEENPIETKNDTETAPKIPIRQAILGEWKMVEHENFEELKKKNDAWTLEQFSENLKFKLVDGKLKRSGGGHPEITEKEYENEKKFFYVDGDHVKSYWPSGDTVDFYIQNGQLHFVLNWKDGSTTTRIYEREDKLSEKKEQKEEKPVVAGNETVIEEQNLEVENKAEEQPEENPIASKNDTEPTPNIPIRQAVLGEWKIVEYENSERFINKYNSSLEVFSQNLKFELVDEKLKQTGAGYGDLIEGEYGNGRKFLYVDGDHLKTLWSFDSTEDMYIIHGKLYFVENYLGTSWKRIYEKL